MRMLKDHWVDLLIWLVVILAVILPYFLLSHDRMQIVKHVQNGKVVKIDTLIIEEK